MLESCLGEPGQDIAEWLDAYRARRCVEERGQL